MKPWKLLHSPASVGPTRIVQISSGAVLTKQSGGNFALALLLTVAGNSIGVLTAPLMLSFFADTGSEGVSRNPT